MEDAIAKIMKDDNAPTFHAPEPIQNLTDSLKHMLLEVSLSAIKRTQFSLMNKRNYSLSMSYTLVTYGH